MRVSNTIRFAVLLGLLAAPAMLSAQARGNQRPPQVDTERVVRDSAGNVVFRREVFNYPSSGRRDPFGSLLESGDIRPLLQDLEIVAITLAPSQGQSIATLKDVSSNEIYRVRVGSQFGRMRVVAIRQREVVLAIDEFGNTRQETLSITVPVGGGRTP